MKKMFPCRVAVTQRAHIPVLDIIFETPNEEILNRPLLGFFLKYLDISSKYGGVIFNSDATVRFPMQKENMYVRFSLIFPNEEQIREYVKVTNNLRPDNWF